MPPKTIYKWDIESYSILDSYFTDKLNKIYELDKMRTNTSYQMNGSNFRGAISARKYVVGSFSEQSGLSVSANPYVHESLTAANAEAQRLAKLNPGKIFIALQIVGGAVANNVTIL